MYLYILIYIRKWQLVSKVTIFKQEIVLLISYLCYNN